LSQSNSEEAAFVFCQVCGLGNRDDAEFCSRCQNKLLVLSGAAAEEEEAFEEGTDSFSFDEHLLERISILEEVLKRTGETVRNILGAVHKQEENILINHAGLATVRDLLEQKGIAHAEEWSDLWESKMDYQLLALEKRERFSENKNRMAALYDGDKREIFLRLLDEAEYGFYAFNLEKAMEALASAFKLHHENYELGHFLGESYFHEGQTDQALHFFSRVLAVKPEHYEGLVYSGVIHHQRGENRRAEDLLKRAVALYPEAFLPQFSLGATYAGQGNLARAVVYLEKAVLLDAVPQAHYLLGSCHYEMGRLKQAILDLNEALKLDPGFEECYHLLGLCYLDRRWTRKALDAFKQAQNLNPKKMRYQDLVRYLSGHAVVALPEVGQEVTDLAQRAEEAATRGEGKEALALYRQALAQDPDSPTLLMSYSVACLHLGRSQEIRTVTEKILDLNPGEMLRATAYATLIEALRGEGKFMEGNRIGQRLLDEGSSDFSKAIAYYEMAYTLAEMEEDLDEALHLARRSLECSPEELKHFSFAALGWVHYKRQEFPDAVDFLGKATEAAPSATTMTHLGMALIAAGEDERAKDVLDHARHLDDRGGQLEETMMEFMKDSARILKGVRRDD